MTLADDILDLATLITTANTPDLPPHGSHRVDLRRGFIGLGRLEPLANALGLRVDRWLCV